MSQTKKSKQEEVYDDLNRFALGEMKRVYGRNGVISILDCLIKMMLLTYSMSHKLFRLTSDKSGNARFASIGKNGKTEYVCNKNVIIFINSYLKKSMPSLCDTTHIFGVLICDDTFNSSIDHLLSFIAKHPMDTLTFITGRMVDSLAHNCTAIEISGSYILIPNKIGTFDMTTWEYEVKYPGNVLYFVLKPSIEEYKSDWCETRINSSETKVFDVLYRKYNYRSGTHIDYSCLIHIVRLMGLLSVVLTEEHQSHLVLEYIFSDFDVKKIRELTSTNIETLDEMIKNQGNGDCEGVVLYAYRKNKRGYTFSSVPRIIL